MQVNLSTVNVTSHVMSCHAYNKITLYTLGNEFQLSLIRTYGLRVPGGEQEVLVGVQLPSKFYIL